MYEKKRKGPLSTGRCNATWEPDPEARQRNAVSLQAPQQSKLSGGEDPRHSGKEIWVEICDTGRAICSPVSKATARHQR